MYPPSCLSAIWAVPNSSDDVLGCPVEMYPYFVFPRCGLRQTPRMACSVVHYAWGRIRLGKLSYVEEPIGDRVGVDILAMSLGDP
ncbi:hypothetical protein CDL15_Pgr008284 [Punica granatum]|uniref:Uncharacterized protein n=1 Tax=Punica granatum TaxID=22663 RepID=A0A218WDF7_PUNGR|nr:hypothetical protein CDL15_Pgr008284 [Punica granatum]